MWSVGCFYGTGEELIKKAYNDSEEKGREYERIVKYVESIKTRIQMKKKVHYQKCGWKRTDCYASHPQFTQRSWKRVDEIPQLPQRKL